MDCPFCKNQNTKVLDSRTLKQGQSIRRRRKCIGCDRRFTTYETLEISMPKVYKNDGRREDYNREKIFRGIEKSCQKLPVSPDQIDRIIDHVERSILENNPNEVKSKEIGHVVMMHLKHLNPVAFIRFASVYKSFHDIEEFIQDLRRDELKFKSQELSKIYQYNEQPSIGKQNESNSRH